MITEAVIGVRFLINAAGNLFSKCSTISGIVATITFGEQCILEFTTSRNISTKRKTFGGTNTMKTFWNNLVAAFTMYSKIPMPNIELTEENTKYSLCFFPLVGVVIGAILCGWRIAYPYLCNGDFL